MLVWCCILLLLLLLLQVLEPLMANASPQPPAISPAAGGQPLGKQKQKAQAKQKAAQQQQQAPGRGHITMADFPTLDLAAAVQAGDADASVLDMRDTVMDALNNLKIGGWRAWMGEVMDSGR